MNESGNPGRRAHFGGKIAAALAVAAALALPCAPAAAQAGQVVTAGWHPAGLVTRVHPGDGSGYFYFSSATPLGIAGCDNNFGYAFSDAGNVASRNLALLMMAYSTGKPISIPLTGGCLPSASRPIVDTVEITEVNYY